MLGAALLVALLTQDVDALLDQGRFTEALELTAEITAPADRFDARARVLGEAGDLAGALRAARQSAEADPTALVPSWRAVNFSLWLSDGAGAAQALEELRARVDRADLTPAVREEWSASLASLGALTAGLVEDEADADAALRRARWTAGGALMIALLVACSWFVRGRGPK